MFRQFFLYQGDFWSSTSGPKYIFCKQTLFKNSHIIRIYIPLFISNIIVLCVILSALARRNRTCLRILVAVCNMSGVRHRTYHKDYYLSQSVENKKCWECSAASSFLPNKISNSSLTTDHHKTRKVKYLLPNPLAIRRIWVWGLRYYYITFSVPLSFTCALKTIHHSHWYGTSIYTYIHIYVYITAYNFICTWSVNVESIYSGYGRCIMYIMYISWVRF